MERRMLNLIVAIAVILALATYVWSVGSAKDKEANISVTVNQPRPASDEGFGFQPSGDFTFVQGEDQP